MAGMCFGRRTPSDDNEVLISEAEVLLNHMYRQANCYDHQQGSTPASSYCWE
jgi:hypothetical protein